MSGINLLSTFIIANLLGLYLRADIIQEQAQSSFLTDKKIIHPSIHPNKQTNIQTNHYTKTTPSWYNGSIQMSNEGLCTKTGFLNRISYHLTRGPNRYSSKISGNRTRTNRNAIWGYFASIWMIWLCCFLLQLSVTWVWVPDPVFPQKWARLNCPGHFFTNVFEGLQDKYNSQSIDQLINTQLNLNANWLYFWPHCVKKGVCWSWEGMMLPLLIQTIVNCQL